MGIGKDRMTKKGMEAEMLLDTVLLDFSLKYFNFLSSLSCYRPFKKQMVTLNPPVPRVYNGQQNPGDTGSFLQGITGS